MTRIDYLVTLVGVLILVAVGFLASRRTQNQNTSDFIVGGRRLPWWLAGTAMVAGSSNADSPLHQSGKIRRDGLAGAWFYWSQILPQLWHSVVFSRLWRRTGLETVVEFYALRYGGRASVVGRVWSMASASLVEGPIALALGMLAMIRISQILLGMHDPWHLGGWEIAPEVVLAVVGVGLSLAYSTVAGLLGVVAGDVVEFVIAIGCSYLLMFIVYREVGYSAGLAEGLRKIGAEAALRWAPELGGAWVIFLLVQPLAMAAGSNGISQRYLALRDEKEAVFSGIWRIINHYIVRGWPWYVCGLIGLVLLPDLTLERESIYPKLIATYMPEGLRGLMFAGFVVAFMSSVSSSMHAAGAVMVNDFYRPFVRREAPAVHYVRVIRCAMVALGAVATIIALNAQSVLGLLQFLMQVISASGIVLLLRWFWWRMNGWGDLAAQMMALPVTLTVRQAGEWIGPQWDLVARLSSWWGGAPDQRYAAALLITVGVTTAVSLLVVLLTPPESPERLAEFYRRVRPYGWWAPVARACPDVVVTDRFSRDLRYYLLALLLTMALIIGVGSLLLGAWGWGLGLVLGAIAVGVGLVRAIDRAMS